jgi:Fic family protein
MVVEALYINPLIDAEGVSSIIKSSKDTSYRLIKELERLEIIKNISGRKRHKLYLFERYIQLFNS